MMRPKQIAEILKALSAEKRVEIIDMLKDGPCCVSSIADRLDISEPATSQHLRILKALGVVDNRRDGLNIYYCLCPKRLDKLNQIIKSVCCCDMRCCQEEDEEKKRDEG